MMYNVGRCTGKCQNDFVVILEEFKRLIQICMVNSVDYRVISWLVVLLYDLPLSVCGELAPEDCRLTLIALGQSCFIGL
jgi:hypothetical protein